MMKKWLYTTLLILFFLNGKQSLVYSQKKGKEITLHNYKEIIEQTFFSRIEGDSKNNSLRDSILNFIETNNIKIKDNYTNSIVHYFAGNKNLNLKRYKLAEEGFLKAYELAKKTTNLSLKAEIESSLGVTYDEGWKDYQKGAEYYIKAITSLDKIKNKCRQIDIYFNLTVNARDRKDWESSIEYANTNISLIKKCNKRKKNLKILHYLLGYSYSYLNKYNEALKNLKIAKDLPAINITSNNNNSYIDALISSTSAKLYESQGKYKPAIAELNKTIEDLKNSNREKQKKIHELFIKELDFEEKLKLEKDIVIKDQKKFLLLSILTTFLFSIFTITLTISIRKNRKKSKSINKLNKRLKNLISNLKNKNEEVKSLLKANEQALFSRVFKISTYNDSILKIGKDIETYIDNSPNAPIYLSTVYKKLLKLVSEEELWKDFKIQFEKIRPDFFNKLKELAPNLSVNDLKHCTYIVSNLKSKEVAQLINVSPRSVETTRYRIKKKMNLKKEDCLYSLLSSL